MQCFRRNTISICPKEENSSVLFTVSAYDADDTLLGEGTFLYDVAQEKLYVTISEDSVTCSTSDATDAPADVPPMLTLPILDEIDTSVTVGTSGSSLSASNFILPETGKPCLLFCHILFAQLIVPYH